MKLKFPPAVIFIIFGALMYLLASVLPMGDFDFFGRLYLMYALVILGILIGVLALLQFFRSKTSVNPLDPALTSNLVTKGIFQYSRNPMYLALLLLLLAWGLWLGNAFNALVATGFVGYMNKFQIIPEEEILKEKFSGEYSRYCTLVRRWF